MLLRPHLLLTQPFPTGRRLPLDIAPGAAAAYSLRKLSSAYAGKAVNIRRASDNAMLDVGFLGNDFDIGAFATFIGGSTGLVAKWYDQSGNLNDAVQASGASQPQLITSRAALNGRPVIQFATDGGVGGSSDLVTLTATSINNIWNAGAFLAHVFNIVATATANGGVIGKSAGWDPRISSGTRKYSFVRNASGTNGTWVITNDMAVGGHTLSVSYSSASLANVPAVSVDGAAQTFGTSTQPVGTLGDDTVNGLRIGNRGAAAFPGDMAEIILWPSSPSAAAIQANQKAYFGTP